MRVVRGMSQRLCIGFAGSTCGRFQRRAEEHRVRNIVSGLRSNHDIQ
jgi:hypothetical protein